MAALGKSNPAGPCDNRLHRLAEAMEALRTAAESVADLVATGNAYVVATDLVRHYDFGPCAACCSGKRLGLLSVAADELEVAPVEEAQTLLDAVPVKQITAEQHKDIPSLRDGVKGVQDMLWESDLKWHALKKQQSTLLEARQATKVASQAMRASLKSRGDKIIECFESFTQTPAQIMASLRAAAESERTAQESVQVMANHFATHLAKTHHYLSAHLASVMLRRSSIEQDLEELGLTRAEKVPPTSASFDQPGFPKETMREELATPDLREEAKLAELPELFSEAGLIMAGEEGASNKPATAKEPHSLAAPDEDLAMGWCLL